jgi:hypothetical protein
MRAGAAQWRGFRELTKLLGRRLDRTGIGRFARWGSLLLGMACIAWVVLMRVQDGAHAPTLGVPLKIARASVWLCALPVALAAAHQRRLADRRDGVEALLFSRGIPARAQTAARVVAASVRVARAVMIPAGLAAVASLAAAPNASSLIDRALALFAVGCFAVLVAVVLGPIGALAEVVAPQRGRSLVLGVVVGSWALADLAGNPALSVTGVFGLFLRGLAGTLGLGGAA